MRSPILPRRSDGCVASERFVRVRADTSFAAFWGELPSRPAPGAHLTSRCLRSRLDAARTDRSVPSAADSGRQCPVARLPCTPGPATACSGDMRSLRERTHCPVCLEVLTTEETDRSQQAGVAMRSVHVRMRSSGPRPRRAATDIRIHPAPWRTRHDSALQDILRDIPQDIRPGCSPAGTWPTRLHTPTHSSLAPVRVGVRTP